MNPNWVETQELITATFELPAGDREQFVRDHCVDPELREQIAALVNPVESISAGDNAPPEFPTGSHVGPYIVVRRLGRGGMGEVFLGRDPRLDRPVALKCLLTSRGGSEDLRARVIREARAAARITHPHVAAVHDVLEHEGRAFIIMEYVEGETLGVLLKREPLSPSRVTAMGRQLASALAAAHAAGIIHRDLKPANIQVTPDGSIKILDFGIARAFAALTTTRTAVTAVTDTGGPQPGTLVYMSPEQLLGRSVDERSDLFSAGVILFEMATGRRPCTASDPLGVLAGILATAPRADAVDRRVPPELADVIAKALVADPAGRFQSAVELGTALDAVREALHSTGSGRPAPATFVAPVATRHAGRVAALALAAPVALWVLGRVSSAAYNTTLGRAGGFAADPPLQHLVWGAKSLVAPCVYAALAVVAVWSAGFVIRLLALVPAVGRVVSAVRGRWRAIVATLSLDDPIMLAQGLAAIGSVTLAGVAWRFSSLIQAWSTMISTGPVDLLWRLGPANENEKVLYRAVLTVSLIAMSAGLVRVVRLRARHGTRGNAGGLVALAIVVAAFLLMNEAPYRILWKSYAQRSDYNGARCYIIGTEGTDSLLFCPGSAPPRNKIVHANDPGFRTLGITENIFSITRAPVRGQEAR